MKSFKLVFDVTVARITVSQIGKVEVLKTFRNFLLDNSLDFGPHKKRTIME